MTLRQVVSFYNSLMFVIYVSSNLFLLSYLFASFPEAIETIPLILLLSLLTAVLVLYKSLS